LAALVSVQLNGISGEFVVRRVSQPARLVED